MHLTELRVQALLFLTIALSFECTHLSIAWFVRQSCLQILDSLLKASIGAQLV